MLARGPVQIRIIGSSWVWNAQVDSFDEQRRKASEAAM